MAQHSDVTAVAKSVIKIHKHEVSIWVDRNLEDQIREGSPKSQIKDNGSGLGWIWWLVGAALLLALFGV
jgi:hypothetical protein